MKNASGQPESLLARRLRESMQGQGLSLRKLADKTLVTYEHLRKTVNGETIPSNLALKAICGALKLPFEELEKLAKRQRVLDKYGDVLSEMTGKKPGMQPVEDVWDDLTPEHQQDLIGMAHRWAASDRVKKKEVTEE